MKLRHAFYLLVAILVATPAMAQWQWLDQDGKKVYSDRSPPPDIPEKNILKRPSGAVRPAVEAPAADPVAAGKAASPTPAPAKLGVDKELEARKKAAADAEAAKRKAEDEAQNKALADNCQRARQAKVTLDSGVRMSRVNDKGEREVMDDAARAQELKRIQAAIASDCK